MAALVNDLSNKTLTNKEAESLVNFADARPKENNVQNLKILATKEDIANLRTEIASSKKEMIKWFVAFFIANSLMILGLYSKK